MAREGAQEFPSHGIIEIEDEQLEPQAGGEVMIPTYSNNYTIIVYLQAVPDNSGEDLPFEQCKAELTFVDGQLSGIIMNSEDYGDGKQTYGYKFPVGFVRLVNSIGNSGQGYSFQQGSGAPGFPQPGGVNFALGATVPARLARLRGPAAGY